MPIQSLDSSVHDSSADESARAVGEVHLLDLAGPVALGLVDGFVPALIGPGPVVGAGGDVDWPETVRANVLLFLRTTVDELELAALAVELRRHLRQPGNDDTGILWIENPTEPLERWRTNAIPFRAGPDGLVTGDKVSYLDIRNYSIVVPADSPVLIGPDDDGVMRLTLQPDDPDGLAVTSGHGRHRHRTTGPVLDVVLSGERLGCVELALAVDREDDLDGGFGYPALAQLDVGMHLSMVDPDVPPGRGRPALRSHRYPLVDEFSTNRLARPFFPERLWLDVVLDPLYPLVGQRSHLAWGSAPDGLHDPSGDPADDQGDDPIDLPSGYRTNMGYTVHLAPVGDQGRLHLAERPIQAVDAGADPGRPDLYLTPAGTYRLRVPRYDEQPGRARTVVQPRLVCGLSGLEYVAIDPERTELVFVPGQPAHLTGHRSVSALLRDLPVIIRQELGITLIDDTADQDQPITTAQAEQVLGRVRGLHLPAGYRPSSGRRAELAGIEVVDELVAWLQHEVWSSGASTGDPSGPLSSLSTTSWAYLRNRPDGDDPTADGDDAASEDDDPTSDLVAYYAQPEPATLYRPWPAEAAGSATGAGGPATGADILDYLEVPALWLPASLDDTATAALLRSTGSDVAAFPMLPYGGTDRGDLADLRRVEEQVISGVRRDRVQHISAAAGHPPIVDPDESADTTTTAEAPGPTGTTAQGLLATFSSDLRSLAEVRLGLDTARQPLALRSLEHGSALKAMFQTNRLFAVISDPDLVAGHLSEEPLEIDGWSFQLRPGGWSMHGSFLVFKFVDQPLIELVEDTARWFQADDFNQRNAAAVSRRLAGKLRRVVEIATTGDAKERRKFRSLARAATAANWTGVLAFDVTVPLSGLPDELLALAGGIDPDRFFADHVGIEVTPIEVESDPEPVLTAGTSSLFGLIDYRDPVIPRAGADGYNFHVPSLSVVLANSQVADFGAEVLLVADRLFGEPTTLLDGPDGRNVLRLVGVAEKHDGVTTYSFGFSGANRFALPGPAIDEIEVVRAQFVTDPLPTEEDGKRAVTGRFLLWSMIRFGYRPDFDILSFGPTPGAPPATSTSGDDASADALGVDASGGALSVDNLQVAMSFDLATDPPAGESPVSRKRFEFVADRLSFDLERSGFRANSLYQKFPLKLTGFGPLETGGGALARNGFMPVTTPDRPGTLGEEAYGLTFELNLGSAGALAGSVGLVARLVAAWSPGGDGIHVGLALPGSVGGKKELTIQGVVTIAFGEIRFIVNPLDPSAPAGPGQERAVGYLLKLRDLTLKVLVLTLPTGGHTEILLFGDPRDDIERDQRLLGWFASYDRGPNEDETAGSEP